MEKYQIYYFVKDGESIPMEYSEVMNEEDTGKTAEIVFESYVNNYIKDFPDDQKEAEAEKYFGDVNFRVCEKELNIKLPDWCKENNGDYDQVAYLVVDRRKKDEDAFLGLYASEYEAWRVCHDTISEEDLEMAEPKPIYYVRLFKLLIKNVMPFGEGVYAKYNFEKMEFDI